MYHQHLSCAQHIQIDYGSLITKMPQLIRTNHGGPCRMTTATPRHSGRQLHLWTLQAESLTTVMERTRWRGAYPVTLTSTKTIAVQEDACLAATHHLPALVVQTEAVLILGALKSLVLDFLMCWPSLDPEGVVDVTIWGQFSQGLLAVGRPEEVATLTLFWLRAAYAARKSRPQTFSNVAV